MNWQMWLLVGLLVFILVILSALALLLYAQNRRISDLSDYFNKSLENKARLKKRFKIRYKHIQSALLEQLSICGRRLLMLKPWPGIMKQMPAPLGRSFKRLRPRSKNCARSSTERSGGL